MQQERDECAAKPRHAPTSPSVGPTCPREVDFTDSIIRDVLIAGIVDLDIRREVLGTSVILERDVNDVISLVESKEMARNALPSTASGISSFKRSGAHSRSVHVASPARFQICNNCGSRIILLPPLHKSKKVLPRKRDTSHCRTKGPFSGPALTSMSFNGEWLSTAKEQLIADLRQRLQCAVVCIQETHRGPDAIRPSIPGMDSAIERPHSQYGSAIFVTPGTIVNTTSLTDINNIEILRVDLNGMCHEFRISIYSL